MKRRARAGVAAAVLLALSGSPLLAGSARAADPLTYPTVRNLTVGVTGDPTAIAVKGDDSSALVVVGEYAGLVTADQTAAGPDAGAEVTDAVPLRGTVQSMVYDPNNNGVYLAESPNGSGSGVQEVEWWNLADTGESTVGGSVTDNNYPLGVAVDVAMHRVYVADGNNDLNSSDSPGVTVINDSVDSNTQGASTHHRTNGSPLAVAVDPSTHYVYVATGTRPTTAGDKTNAETGAGTVQIFDGSTSRFAGVTSVPVGQGPDAIAVDPGLHKVFVANKTDSTVSVIDTTTDTVVQTAPVIGAASMALDTGRGELFVSDGSSTTEVLRESDLSRLGVAAGPAVAIADDSTNHRLLTFGPCDSNCGGGGAGSPSPGEAAEIVSHVASGPVPVPTSPASVAPTSGGGTGSGGGGGGVTSTAGVTATAQAHSGSSAAGTSTGAPAAGAGGGGGAGGTAAGGGGAPAGVPAGVPFVSGVPQPQLAKPGHAGPAPGAGTFNLPQPGRTSTTGSGSGGGSTSGDTLATAAHRAAAGPTPFVDHGAAQNFSLRLASPSQAFRDKGRAGIDLVLALVMVALLALPVALVNATAEEHAEELGRAGAWIRRKLGLPAIGEASSKLPILAAMAISGVIGGVLYSFLDQNLGFSEASLELLIGLTAGLIVTTALLEGTQAVFYRFVYNEPHKLKLYPGFVFVALVCVVMSRVLDLQPGLMLGSLAGLVAVEHGHEHEHGSAEGDFPEEMKEGQAISVSAVTLAVVSIAAWAFRADVTNAFGPKTFLGVTFGVGMTTLAVGASEFLLFELLPFTFFEGKALYEWNRKLWTVLELFGTFVFIHLLLGGTRTGDGQPFTHRLGFLAVTAVVYLSLAFGFWAFFRYRARREHPAAQIV